MGVEFDILEKKGPRLRPIRSMDEVVKIQPLNPVRSTPFVSSILQNLRKEVGHSAAVLGFVGLPFTMATYLIEGGPSIDFKLTKEIAYRNPDVMHEMLKRLAHNIADYAIFQIESGAQVMQVFDSWAAILSPYDYDEFAAPYQRMVIDKIKKAYPATPIIIYIAKSGALLEKMADSGADIVSVDWTVTMKEACQRILPETNVGLQGNLDPSTLLLGQDALVLKQTNDIITEAAGRKHIMNLGHGIDAQTSEDRVKLFVDAVKSYRF